MNDLRKWCRDNWNQIPEEKRRLCVDHLKGWITKKEYIEGYDNYPSFHFSGGMTIRNRLRDVMKDDELPGVMYEGNFCQNWDDYYTGALDQLIEEWV